jgi:hypothetical protein
VASGTPDSGINRLIARLDQLIDPAPHIRHLGEALEKILVEDNRAGVLAGLDKDGNPLEPTTYRDSGGGAAYKRRRGKAMGTVDLAAFKGFGLGGTNGNLTRKEYQVLTGPPLAPRGENSRVIANLRTRHSWSGKELVVEGAWLDVVSAKGVPFLIAHFQGRNRLPRRDLRGVRPSGRKAARTKVAEWAKALAAGP